jgi:lactate dehydrogenase-like 2-hydroxyacid dehydrogenase
MWGRADRFFVRGRRDFGALKRSIEIPASSVLVFERARENSPHEPIEIQPDPTGDDLWREAVVLTPHIGTATHETRLKMGALVLANLDAHFAGKDLLTPVV